MAISLLKRQVIRLKKDPYVAPKPRVAVVFQEEQQEAQPQVFEQPPAPSPEPLPLEPKEPLPSKVSLPVDWALPPAQPEAPAFDLSTITVGIGWKIQEPVAVDKRATLGSRILNSRFVKSSLLGRLLGGGDEEAVDLDVIAFLLDKNGHVFELGDSHMVGSDVIFFNNPRHFTGGIVLRGDNRIGGAGVQDEEQIIAKLSELRPCYEKVKFLVSIYDGQNKHQHFGALKDAYVRALDARGREIARCDLNTNPFYVGRCLLVFGEAVRSGDAWKFQLLGEAHSSDNFETVLADHLPPH